MWGAMGPQGHGGHAQESALLCGRLGHTTTDDTRTWPDVVKVQTLVTRDGEGRVAWKPQRAPCREP